MIGALEVLKSARARIAKPENWAQGNFAYDSNGFAVASRDKHAVCWCALGAIITVLSPYSGEAGEWLALAIAGSRVRSSIPEFNDRSTTTHDDVLGAFDKAIAMIEREMADG